MTLLLRTFLLGSVTLLSFTAAHGAQAQALTSSPPAGTLISDRGIVLNPSTHKVYAVDQARGAVTIVDIRTRTAKSVATGARPDAIAISRTTNRVYVVNSGAGNVSVVDGVTDQVVGTLKTDRRPYYVALNEATNKAYVSNTFSKVMTVMDLMANTTNDWPTGSGDAVAVDPKKNQVFLLGYEDPNIRVMDGTTGEITREPVGSIHAWAPAVDEELRKLYVTRVGSADVLVIDLDTRAHSVLKVGNYPCAIAIDPATHNAYVTNYADNTVSVIDGRRGTVVRTISVGTNPQSVAVDSNRRRVYIGNLRDNDVSVLDAAKMRVIKTLPAGKHPYAVVTDPSTGAVFAGNMPDPENTDAPTYTTVVSAIEK